MVSPIRFYVNQRVRLTTASFDRAVAHSRSAVHAGYPSQEFLDKLKAYIGTRGKVTHTFPPGYDVTVEFHDGQCFHMKECWIEPALPERELYVVTNDHDAEDTSWFESNNMRRVHRRSGMLSFCEAWEADAILMALQDKTEMRVGAGPRRMRRYVMHGEPYNWIDPVTKTSHPRYAIVLPAFINPSAVSRGGSLYNLFRVVNLWTGAESSLYNVQECERIIMLGLSYDLKGSFQ